MSDTNPETNAQVTQIDVLTSAPIPSVTDDLDDVPLSPHDTPTHLTTNITTQPVNNIPYCVQCGDNKTCEFDKCLKIRPCCQEMTIHESCFENIMKKTSNKCPLCNTDLSHIIVHRKIQKCAWENFAFYTCALIIIFISAMNFYYTYYRDHISTYNKNVIYWCSVGGPIYIFIKYSRSSAHGSIFWTGIYSMIYYVISCIQKLFTCVFITCKSLVTPCCACCNQSNEENNSCSCCISYEWNISMEIPHKEDGWIILGEDNYYYFNTNKTSTHGLWKLYETKQFSQLVINIFNWALPLLIYVGITCLLIYGYIEKFHIQSIIKWYKCAIGVGLIISNILLIKLFFIPFVIIICSYIKDTCESTFCRTTVVHSVKSSCIVKENIEAAYCV